MPRRFVQWHEGEVEIVDTREGIQISCCDCGLVHDFDIKITGPNQVSMKVKNMPRLTKRQRKLLQKNLEGLWGGPK